MKRTSLDEFFEHRRQNHFEVLASSEAYAEFILDNYDPSVRVICNGDTLLEAQEALYLFPEFLMSLDKTS